VSFNREWTVKAVRRHARCDGCGQQIEVGQPAHRWAGMTDGDFASIAWHPECRAAEIMLNDLSGIRHGDDWMRLDDRDPEDDAWLRAEHPIVADRLGIPT